MYADHNSIILVGNAYAIVKSVAPPDITGVVKAPVLPYGNTFSRTPCIIGDRLFTTMRHVSNFDVSLLDMSACASAAAIPLCAYRIWPLSLKTARWRSHTWVSIGSDWGEQRRESRELCTFVDMNVSSRNCSNYSIATGEGRLYGHVRDDTGGECISALDPRETNCASNVYQDGTQWRWSEFRDVSNGLALSVVSIMDPDVGRIYDVRYQPVTINIFDERACAMIGTGMFMGLNETLFCLINTSTQLKRHTG